MINPSKKKIKILLLLFPGLGLICFFIAAVITMAVIQSLGFFNFSGESSFTLAHWSEQLGERQFWRAFFYSLRIAVISAFLSVSLAYPLALWLKKAFKGSFAVSAMLKIPMLIHGLIAAFLYINVISYHGFFNEILLFLRIIDEPLRMQNDKYAVGIVILQVWKQMPFALLLLAGAVNSIGNDILDAAQDLGAGALDRFLKVTAPLTMKSLQAALIIIFIGAAGDFSFQAIAGPTHVSSMAQRMLRTQSIIGNWNGSAVIAVMLMLMSLVGALLLALFVQILINRGQRK